MGNSNFFKWLHVSSFIAIDFSAAKKKLTKRMNYSIRTEFFFISNEAGLLLEQFPIVLSIF